MKADRNTDATVCAFGPAQDGISLRGLACGSRRFRATLRTSADSALSSDPGNAADGAFPLGWTLWRSAVAAFALH